MKIKSNFLKIGIIGLILFCLILCFNPLCAKDYGGYTTNVNGFTFNMINGYEPDYEMVINEDSTNIFGDKIHLYILTYRGNGSLAEDIDISTITRYSEPFTQEDLKDIGSNTHDMTTTFQTIGGKNGKLVEDRSLGSPSYTFWYIEGGVEISIHTDNVDKIKYCLGETSK